MPLTLPVPFSLCKSGPAKHFVSTYHFLQSCGCDTGSSCKAGSLLFLNSLSARYWLWYTTKTYVGGIAKKVYERLRMYQVNFIALQRKRDPEQVLLQCVPKHKVWSVLHYLAPELPGPPFARYKGNSAPNGPVHCPRVTAGVCCHHTGLVVWYWLTGRWGKKANSFYTMVDAMQCFPFLQTSRARLLKSEKPQ